MLKKQNKRLSFRGLLALKLLTGKRTSEMCSFTIHEPHFFSSPRPRKGGCLLSLFFSVTGLDLKLRPCLSCPVCISERCLPFTSPTSDLSSVLWTQSAPSVPAHTSVSVI